jgi:ribosomal protein S18 acetylase RimI-like enzyme
MKPVIRVEELHEDQWQRYRDIRLSALENDGHAFGGNLDSERQFTESEWRSKAKQYVALIAVINGVDVGMMTVENLNGDFGATCWVGSCWVDSDFRKHGALRSLFTYLDTHAFAKDWATQGLGVWVDNDSAIKAYEKLGFIQMGVKQESSRKAGMYYQRMIRKSPNT